MKKFTVLLLALCAFAASRVSAQYCAGYFIVPTYDEPDTVYVDLHESLLIVLAGSSRGTLTATTIPPGFQFSQGSNRFGAFYGEALSPGTYTFSVHAENTELGCSDDYTFQRTYIESPTHICEKIEIGPDRLTTDAYVGETIDIDFDILSGGEDPPFTFSGVNLPTGATLDPVTGEFSHYVNENQSYEFEVVVTDSFGCSGSISSNVNIMCNPENMYYTNLAGGTRGQFYQQSVPPAPALLPPYSNFVAVDPLPAGLSLSTSGVLSGTPTISGTFAQLQVSVTGLAGCTASTYITLTIQSNVATQRPWIEALCTETLDERKWALHNLNAFNINIGWQTMYGNIISGSFSAAPGENVFTTPNAGWPNSIRITWYDGTTPAGTIVQGANDNLCNPPSCVELAAITFYHQGIQKDGNSIPIASSNPNAVLGQPDGLDAPGTESKSFSLGFYGFITLQLNTDLHDQPGPDLKVWENTVNDPIFADYPERAEVFVSTDNSTWISLGYTNPTLDCNQKLDWEFDLAGKASWCRYVKVLDRTMEWSLIKDPQTCFNLPGVHYAFNNTANGFDLDAITCVTPTAPNGRMAADISASDVPSFNDDLSDPHSVLSPNPATSIVTFDLSKEPAFANASGVQVEINIVDMSGRKIQGRTHVLDDGLTTSENVTDLNAGFFVAQIRATGFSKYYRFMKR